MDRDEQARILRLGAGDAHRLRELLGVFAEAFEDPVYLAEQPDDDYLERLLASPTFVAVVAVASATVVGGATAYELVKPERAVSELYLYDLAVLTAFRRRGIATALIGELSRCAAERGASVLFVQADLGDEPAIALYSKLGKREDVLHFDISPG